VAFGAVVVGFGGWNFLQSLSDRFVGGYNLLQPPTTGYETIPAWRKSNQANGR
jgi:hypothetical protein